MAPLLRRVAGINQEVSRVACFLAKANSGVWDVGHSRFASFLKQSPTEKPFDNAGLVSSIAIGYDRPVYGDDVISAESNEQFARIYSIAMCCFDMPPVIESNPSRRSGS